MHWKPQQLIKRLSPSPSIRSWLLTPGSLTQRIRQVCPEMQVEVLSEAWQIPLRSEALALNLPIQEKAWIRCVMLKCGQQDWVYARTVIPQMTTENPWHSLQTLGDKPLGEVLFELKNLERTEFELNKQPIEAWPLLAERTTLSSQNHCFARRSLFRQHHAPLLLTEVFLPEIFDSENGLRRLEKSHLKH